MVNHGTGSGRQDAAPLHEQLEEATHIAHTVACQLRLLIAAVSVQSGPLLQLCANSFAAGMRELAESVSALQVQLDRIPILSNRQASSEVDECSFIATQVAGLMRLIADAIGVPRLDELEVDIEDFIASVQHLLVRMERVEGGLERVQRDQEHGTNLLTLP